MESLFSMMADNRWIRPVHIAIAAASVFRTTIIKIKSQPLRHQQELPTRFLRVVAWGPMANFMGLPLARKLVFPFTHTQLTWKKVFDNTVIHLCLLSCSLRAIHGSIESESSNGIMICLKTRTNHAIQMDFLRIIYLAPFRVMLRKCRRQPQSPIKKPSVLLLMNLFSILISVPMAMNIKATNTHKNTLVTIAFKFVIHTTLYHFLKP